MQDRPRQRTRDNQSRPSQLPPLRPEQAFLANRQQGVPPLGDGDTLEFELEGVYVISVAARILEMHPQTLRKYERLGLITPVRTVGMLRLYSQDDIRKILLIRHLMDNLGLNLAGVEFVLALVDNLHGLRERIDTLVDDVKARSTLEQEISQLFRNLNLPLEE